MYLPPILSWLPCDFLKQKSGNKKKHLQKIHAQFILLLLMPLILSNKKVAVESSQKPNHYKLILWSAVISQLLLYQSEPAVSQHVTFYSIDDNLAPVAPPAAVQRAACSRSFSLNCIITCIAKIISAWGLQHSA